MKRAASFFGFTSIVLASCSLITKYDGFTGGALDAEAPIDDAASEASSSSGNSCLNAVPSPPVDAGTNTTTETAYYSVTTALRLGPDEAGCAAGVNLDGLDTCEATLPNGPACVAADDAGPFCDDPGGVDNSARNFLSSFSVQSSLNAGLMSESVGFVVGVDNYQGETELSGVHVTLYNLVGEADGGGALVDPSSYVSMTSGVPVYTSSSAYIHDGVLAATFPKFPLTLRAAELTGSNLVPVQAYISDLQLIGRPRLESDGLHIDEGQIAGRVTAANLIYALSEAVGCGINLTLTLDTLNFCKYLDLPSNPVADGTSAPCDALSIGFGFDSSPTPSPGIGTSPTFQTCTDIPANPCAN